MATDTLDVQHQNHTDNGAWSGGKKPFKASYGKLMMWYFLLSDAFTFAGFLIAYGAIRYSMPAWPLPDFVFKTAPFGVEDGPLIFVTFMTFVLIVSSVTMVRAVQEGHRENKNGVVKWMFLTVLGGATFLGCQAWEWTNLIVTEGMTVTQNPFSTSLEGGTYVTLDELAKEAKANDWEKHEIKVPKKEGEKKAKTIVYYQDELDNTYFEKKDHHGYSYAVDPKGKGVKTFTAGTPYLITAGHDSHMYEYGAYRSDVDGKIKAEPEGPIAFGSLFFFITGFHGFHVFSGVVFLIIILLNVMSGVYVERKNGYEMVEKIGLYWHFVDLVWVFVFLVFYLL